MTIEDHREMQDSTPHAAPPAARHEADTKTGSGAVMLTAGGLIAAFGAAACCGLPLVLAGLGLGSAWLIAPASLAAPYLTFLLAIAPLFLIGGAVLLWRQTRTVCASNAICARPVVRAATLVCLLLGVALLYLGYAYMDA